PLTHCRGLPLKPPSLPSELSEPAADLQSNHGAYVVARVWVSTAEYVMIIHGNEIMEPEELAQLGSVFDETWAAVSGSVGEGSAEQRTSLAIILLRLANLRQLGPDQMKATALRIFRSESTFGCRATFLVE